MAKKDVVFTDRDGETVIPAKCDNTPRVEQFLDDYCEGLREVYQLTEPVAMTDELRSVLAALVLDLLNECGAC
jgi:hypothetical protein